MGSLFKILHTQQSEIILEFPRKDSANPFLNCIDLCLEMSSDFNYNFGFVGDEILDLGLTIKSR